MTSLFLLRLKVAVGASIFMGRLDAVNVHTDPYLREIEKPELTASLIETEQIQVRADGATTRSRADDATTSAADVGLEDNDRRTSSDDADNLKADDESTQSPSASLSEKTLSKKKQGSIGKTQSSTNSNVESYKSDRLVFLMFSVLAMTLIMIAATMWFAIQKPVSEVEDDARGPQHKGQEDRAVENPMASTKDLVAKVSHSSLKIASDQSKDYHSVPASKIVLSKDKQLENTSTVASGTGSVASGED